MKAYLLAVALAVTPACKKQNDAHILHHEAVTLVDYYQPKLEALDARVQAIFKKGTEIPGNLPGIQDVGLRLQEARDTLIKLRDLIGVPQQAGDAKVAQKSAVEAQAEAAAKANKVDELAKLVHDTEVTLDRGITVINANLDTVEAWIAQYERKTLAMHAPATATGSDPGTPEAQATPATGQPPPAAQPGAAEPAAAPAAPSAPTPEPKAAAPKAAAPKAAAPKAAAPAPAPTQPNQPQK
jgi:hypothetical protein